VLGVTLPDWVNPDNARTIALLVGVGMVVLIVFVLRFVQKIVLKLAIALVLALVAFVAWSQRADLDHCAKTCDCHLLGFDVQVPDSPTCTSGGA
jgi:hypothetical protein